MLKTYKKNPANTIGFFVDVPQRKTSLSLITIQSRTDVFVFKPYVWHQIVLNVDFLKRPLLFSCVGWKVHFIEKKEQQVEEIFQKNETQMKEQKNLPRKYHDV